MSDNETKPSEGENVSGWVRIFVGGALILGPAILAFSWFGWEALLAAVITLVSGLVGLLLLLPRDETLYSLDETRTFKAGEELKDGEAVIVRNGVVLRAKNRLSSEKYGERSPEYFAATLRELMKEDHVWVGMSSGPGLSSADPRRVGWAGMNDDLWRAEATAILSDASRWGIEHWYFSKPGELDDDWVFWAKLK